jgi:hypothetical protein
MYDVTETIFHQTCWATQHHIFSPDEGLLTQTDEHRCPQCGAFDGKFFATISTSRKEDQSEEPVITVRI